MRESSGSNIEKTLHKVNGFKKNPGSKMSVTDREPKVEIDLWPGGPVAFPVPAVVSDQPQIIRLDGLISSTLSTFLGCGIERA